MAVSFAIARREGGIGPGTTVMVLLYLFVTTAVSRLWSVAAEDGPVAGYTAAMFVWYLATSEICTIAMPMRLIQTVGDQIGGGQIASEMLRPVDVLPIRLAREYGKVMPRLATLSVVGLVYAVSVTRTVPSIAGLLLVVPSILLALALHLVAAHLFAGAAFWFREAGSAWFLFQKLLFVLGGLLIPLEVLPVWFERAARFTPFPSMAYAPARLAAGFVEPELIGYQVLWLVAMFALAQWTFKRGEFKIMRDSA